MNIEAKVLNAEYKFQIFILSIIEKNSENFMIMLMEKLKVWMQFKRFYFQYAKKVFRW